MLAPHVGSASTAGQVPGTTARYSGGPGPATADRIVLVVKDPWWLYAYWDISADTIRKTHAELIPAEVPGLQSVLRVYDVTDSADLSRAPSVDVSLSSLANSWYIETGAPGRTFAVEVGILTQSGRFLPMLRSNRVTAPNVSPAAADPEAPVSDAAYWKLFAATAAFGPGSSSLGITELLQGQAVPGGPSSLGLFAQAISSMGASAPPAKPQPARSFWLKLDCELIVYGATDAKAKVTIQGQPVTLRHDGTFSLRMHLPDGTQTIPVEAVAPDGLELRTITPVVTRQTTATQAMLGQLGDGPGSPPAV